MPANLLSIELCDSMQLQPGQSVLVLSHPWGASGAATAGVVVGVGTELLEMPVHAVKAFLRQALVP